MKNPRKIRRGHIQINRDEQSMLIVCMIPPEKSDTWVNAGKPRQGPVYDLHVKSKARIKYALRFIKNALRKEALTKKLAELNPEAFWREIKTINNCNTPRSAV